MRRSHYGNNQQVNHPPRRRKMEIALKAIKIHKGLSEETYCYTATVLVDGIPAFHASKHGHGGCDNYQPVPGYKGPSELEISAWMKANKEQCSGHGMSLEYAARKNDEAGKRV